MEWPSHSDERGYFRRISDPNVFVANGLDIVPRQWSLSSNSRLGTFRGIHFQWPPNEEGKLVTCVTGSIFDVLIDLRPWTKTRGQCAHLELRANDGRTLYVPPGVAHGFLCLEDNTTLVYGITADYRPDATYGVRWNDPATTIEWPIKPRLVSDRDQNWSDLADTLDRMAILYKKHSGHVVAAQEEKEIGPDDVSHNRQSVIGCK